MIFFNVSTRSSVIRGSLINIHLVPIASMNGNDWPLVNVFMLQKNTHANAIDITKEKTDEISQRGFSKAHPLGKVTGK